MVKEMADVEIFRESFVNMAAQRCIWNILGICIELSRTRPARPSKNYMAGPDGYGYNTYPSTFIRCLFGTWYAFQL